MTTPTTNKTFSPSSKHATAKQWLQRRLRKLPSVQPTNDLGHGGLHDIASLQRPRLHDTASMQRPRLHDTASMQRPRLHDTASMQRPRLHDTASLQRPRTAPSPSVAPESGTVAIPPIPPIPPIPITIQRSRHGASIQPPPRLSDRDSGVARNINAWLDASNTHSPPLMGGVSYWRMATAANVKNTVGVQHATPIVQEARCDRPSVSQGQRSISFRRRARKIHVQMPRLRNKILHQTGRKQVEGRSNSIPVFSIPYEATEAGTPPMIMTRRRSVRNPPLRIVPSMSSTAPSARPPSDGSLLEQPMLRYGSPSSARTSEAEGSIDRRMHALFGRSIRSTDSTRPSTAAAKTYREDSMGDLSDVPSYFTGPPPPPSYHSRPASILTTSSFGCIDGMNPAQRQISRQRAALQRGVKGKLKRLAQNLTSSSSRSTGS